MLPKDAAELRLIVAADTLGWMGLSAKRLFSLPGDFVNSFLRLLGHSLLFARQFEDWEQIAKDLNTICSGNENHLALANWHKAADGHISSNTVDIRHACYSILQKICDIIAMNSRHSTWLLENSKACLCLASHEFLVSSAIPNHLSAVGTIAAGGLLCKSGSLYLFDDSLSVNERKNNENLWLVRLRKDGIYALGPLAGIGDLKPSEVKGMRSFVDSYQGPQVMGRLDPGRETAAAKICSAVGMTVSGNHAWIGHD
jgi:hypothetical protein